MLVVGLSVLDAERKAFAKAERNSAKNADLTFTVSKSQINWEISSNFLWSSL